MKRRVRASAVAGTFYPADPEELKSTVDELLEAASHAPDVPAPRPIKAMIVPHAGYVYSGPIAASAYVQLRPEAERIERVVLLGPCHRVYVDAESRAKFAAFDTVYRVGPVGVVTP